LARVLRRLKIDERSLLLPDQHILWVPATFIYGWYLILRRKIDLIYVTAPPYSALICGALLKLVTGRPLVVDIRDPWSFNAGRKGYPTRLHRWLDLRLEQWVLRLADHITCIYRITRDGYYRIYPWTQGKITVFYDTVDTADLPSQPVKDEVFTLTYLGTFYPPFVTLNATLNAIKQLLDQGAIDPSRFCFNYVGPIDKTFNLLINYYGLERVVRQTGYQPLKAAQIEASKSHMLLLLLEFATINTKLFDYLATGNPILAIVPEFPELEELLATYAGRYFKIDDSDEQKIAESIKQCYNEYHQGRIESDSSKQQLFLEHLNIENETRDLAGIFNQLRGIDISGRH
jgi:hypothetical protein